MVFAELNGRSYGGGVLELMPNEASNILIAYSESNLEYFDYVDEYLRKGGDFEDLIREMDKIILGNIGITEVEQKILYGIWRKLRDRRINRR